MEETLRDSSGSFRKTNVNPFCFEKTRMMKAESLISDKVILRGIVRLELYHIKSGRTITTLPDNTYAAARGFGEVKEGVVDR